MTQYHKKVIEVALTLEAINKASAKEKSIRHGHPCTLHLWWGAAVLAGVGLIVYYNLGQTHDFVDLTTAEDEKDARIGKQEALGLAVQEAVRNGHQADNVYMCALQATTICNERQWDVCFGRRDCPLHGFHVLIDMETGRAAYIPEI